MSGDPSDVVSEEILELMEKEWPSWFPRSMIGKLSNNLFTPATMANYQSQRIGPPVYYMGRVACYKKDSFMAWLRKWYGSMTAGYKPGTFSRRVKRIKQAEDDE